jgi:hypothetical protein
MKSRHSFDRAGLFLKNAVVVFSLGVAPVIHAASLIEFSPTGSSNPLVQSGTTDGVGWTVEISGSGFYRAPFVETGSETQISWETPNQEIGDLPNVLTFSLSFDEPVDDLEFSLRSFGVLVKNYSAENLDLTGGTQSFTLTAYNGDDVVPISSISANVGELIEVTDDGTSLIANALIDDTEGGLIPNTPEAIAARRATFGVDHLITRLVLTFTAEAETTLVSGDTVRIRDISFTTVPEPSSALLSGLLGSLVLLRRRK